MIRRKRESGREMNIHQATQTYENWMRSCTPVIETHLRLKHKQMRKSPFLFFRGTKTGLVCEISVLSSFIHG